MLVICAKVNSCLLHDLHIIPLLASTKAEDSEATKFNTPVKLDVLAHDGQVIDKGRQCLYLCLSGICVDGVYLIKSSSKFIPLEEDMAYFCASNPKCSAIASKSN